MGNGDDDAFRVFFKVINVTIRYITFLNKILFLRYFEGVEAGRDDDAF